MKTEELDWKRIMKCVSQDARRVGKNNVDLVLIEATLRQLVNICGAFSQNRRVLQRIGRCLLGDEVKIIAPVCPDYSHEGGKYTFKSLSGGVSLLAQRHITFLKEVADIIPHAEVTLLVADHEADDPELCRVVGKSRDEFTQLVMKSVIATQEVVKPLGWQVRAMTDLIPDLVPREKVMAESISSRKEFTDRIKSDTYYRADMYRAINRSLSLEEMNQRTIVTASQYMALGSWASEHMYIVCNHTTTNLTWYLQAETGVLHNPIAVY